MHYFLHKNILYFSILKVNYFFIAKINIIIIILKQKLCIIGPNLTKIYINKKELFSNDCSILILVI